MRVKARLDNSHPGRILSVPRKPRTTPRKKPIQARSAETVEVILEATTRVLVREGYEAANTNRIAMEAGVSIGSLYQYFPGKEALVAALAERQERTMWALFEEKLAHLQQATLEEATRELVRLEIAAHAVNPALYRVFIEQVPRIGRLDKVNEILRRVEDLIRMNLEARRDLICPKNIPLAAFLVVHMVQAVARAAVLDRRELLKDEALVDETTDVVVRYLRKD